MKDVAAFVLFLLCLNLSAQNIQIQGRVLDSVNNPLEMATVTATSRATGNITTYAITDYDGRYKLFLPEGEGFILTANFLGMRPGEVQIETAKEKTVDFVLRVDENELRNVELVYNLPVVKRGDTLVYNTESFTNGTERKLGDVLKKLPGIEVNDAGEIKVEGKTVSKVMVDGKDFFDGDSKLATKNIPADALSKVEVLKNFNEVSQMRGLGNDHDNIAINLKLKEGKDRFWFGEVEGGAGFNEKIRYSARSNLFYYSQKRSFNLLSNINNVGDLPMTLQDYFKFSGGVSQPVNPYINLNNSINDLDFLMTQNNRANEIESKFGAVNFNYLLGPKWNMSGFGIFNSNDISFVDQSLRNYIQSGGVEEFLRNSNQRNEQLLGKFSTTYKPHNRFQLDYDILLKFSELTEMTTAESIYNHKDLRQIHEERKNHPFSLHQRMNAYYTLDEENIFAAYTSYLYQDVDPFYQVILDTRPFGNTIPWQLQESYHLNQDRQVRTNRLDFKLDYYHLLNRLSNINISFGVTLTTQDFRSSIHQLLDNNQVINFEEKEFLNRVSYNLYDPYLSLNYKVKKGIFTFTPGLSLHLYKTNNTQNDLTTTRENLLLLPSFVAFTQLGKSETLNFSYKMTADFSEISNLAEGLVFDNYNRIFQGNPYLENGIYNNLSLNYINFDMFNLTNIYANLNYVRRGNAVRSMTVVEKINLISTAVNSNFPDEIFSGNANYQKTFKKIKAKVGGNIMFNTYNLIVNSKNVESKNLMQTYQVSLLSNFKKSPHLEIGYSRTISRYDLGEQNNLYFTNKLFANVELQFLNGFTFLSEWNYHHYSDDEKTIKNEYSFVDAQLSYQKKDSGWEFKLVAKNLLDVPSLNTNSFNQTFSSTTEYFVQPRIVLGSIVYHL